MPTRFLFAAVLLAPAVAAVPAFGQTFNWDGSASDDWGTSANWNINAVPTSSGTVNVEAGTPNDPRITAAGATANSLTVGGGTSGARLWISSSGHLSTAVAGLGAQAGSDGTVTLNGSTAEWNNTGDIFDGSYGTGHILVQAGGEVTNQQAFLGLTPGGIGAATVDGSGSGWSSSGQVQLGQHGYGGLLVQNSGYVGAGDMYFGFYEDGEGHATVSTNGALASAGALAIGNAGVGTLQVTSGGTVSDNAAKVGVGPEATGTVVVTGTGTVWDNTNELVVGYGGSGTLNVDDHAYVHNTTGLIGYQPGANGEVKVDTSGQWDNSANLFVGSQGQGVLTIDGGGVVNATGNVVAGNTVGAMGSIDVVDGTLTAGGNLVVGPFGQGELTIAASGNVVVGGATQIGGNSPGHGPGSLRVDGAIGSVGGLTVAALGTVGGSGSISADTLLQGTVAPGNSIGTLTVMGDYTQDPGSTYVVEVESGGTSDLVAVTGTASLNGGTVEVVPYPDYALDVPYTILSATGGVTGSFDDAKGTVFFTPVLTYDANNAYVTLQAVSMDGLGLTPNEFATAAGAAALGPGNAVYDALAGLSTSRAPAALDSLSGEIHASLRTMLADDSRRLRDIAGTRLRAGLQASGTAPVLGYAGADMPDRIEPGGVPVWAEAFGAYGTWESDGNAAEFGHATGGILIGADDWLVDGWRAGVLAGYSRSGFAATDRDSSGTGQSFHVGAYGGRRFGDMSLTLGAAYSRHLVDVSRTATFPGFSETLTSSYGAATAQGFGEIAYDFTFEGTRLSPFGALALVDVSTDGFAETGGAAALTEAARSSGVAVTAIGVRAERELHLGNRTGTAHGGLAWHHAFGDVRPTSAATLAGGNGFSVTGVPYATDTLAVSAGFDLDLPGTATLGLAYDGEVGAGKQGHALEASYSARF